MSVGHFGCCLTSLDTTRKMHPRGLGRWLSAKKCTSAQQLHCDPRSRQPKILVPWSGMHADLSCAWCSYIDRSDFFNGAAADSPVKGFRGLTLDQDVRLLWSYTLHVNSVVADEEGQPVELRCSVDLESAGSRPKKGMGTIHWVADCNAVDITVNLYDNLFTVEEPLSDENKDHWLDFFNPKSLVVTKVCARVSFYFNRSHCSPVVVFAPFLRRARSRRLWLQTVSVSKLASFSRTSSLAEDTFAWTRCVAACIYNIKNGTCTKALRGSDPVALRYVVISRIPPQKTLCSIEPQRCARAVEHPKPDVHRFLA